MARRSLKVFQPIYGIAAYTVIWNVYVTSRISALFTAMVGATTSRATHPQPLEGHLSSLASYLPFLSFQILYR